MLLYFSCTFVGILDPIAMFVAVPQNVSCGI